MLAVTILVTQAGLDALVDAQNGITAAIEVTEIGLSDAPFTMAPTLTGLPHEFKRISVVSGEAVSETIIHMVAQDASSDVYTAHGFGLFLADGTLFAVYSQPTPLVNKVSIAAFLIAVDIAFTSSIATSITFGNATFLYPPATETVKGVIELATLAEALAGADTVRALTPAPTKAAVLPWMLTQDGAGSGLDADLLDGLHANQLVPPGTIWIHNTAYAAIPAGWQVCDGTNGTPDLRDRFVVGAGVTYAPGATGGAVQHNHGGSTGDTALSAAQLPPHDHELFANATSGTNITSGGAHAAWSTAGGSGNQDYDIKGTATAPTLASSSSVGDGAPHDHTIANGSSLPPYIGVVWIMKL